VTVSGNITAHPEPSMRHARGTSGVLNMIILAIRMVETKKENQYLEIDASEQIIITGFQRSEPLEYFGNLLEEIRPKYTR
jgi:hypothetical protein